jgi:hypothetical protein
MRFPRISESLRARIAAGLLFFCLVASVLAGGADTKW